MSKRRSPDYKRRQNRRKELRRRLRCKTDPEYRARYKRRKALQRKRRYARDPEFRVRSYERYRAWRCSQPEYLNQRERIEHKERLRIARQERDNKKWHEKFEDQNFLHRYMCAIDPQYRERVRRLYRYEYNRKRRERYASDPVARQQNAQRPRNRWAENQRRKLRMAADHEYREHTRRVQREQRQRLKSNPDCRRRYNEQHRRWRIRRVAAQRALQELGIVIDNQKHALQALYQLGVRV